MTAIVDCKGITKHYRQGSIDVPALRGVDLAIEQGDFASLAGPSGSGKTTLLNIVGGLDRPTDGTISIDGQDLTALDNEDLADLRLRKIGFVFQAYNLIPVLSAVENVEFTLQLMDVPAAERRERAKEMLQQVGLESMENRRPSRLSGGQQQRVAVARALASRPSIVLADEPTANLDTQTAEDLIALMSRLNERYGVTFLMATHDDRVISRTRRHIVIADGRVASDERRTLEMAG
ncbi:putative ABC transport system ATP-binding protein [Parvibaculum indicum]|uniref:ABC transporter ATP-binding protein n=1 Tax=Parvibaculum indicum TaxID=562969 RepID=UPI00142298FF|nr:ABC transporter ATP-binding protein [Parvibaculum indicum]NIJ40677.1 putative ABC transport system ATP-binding protein [Parvibaculum indicum]